jgi:hypothetical protein
MNATKWALRTLNSVLGKTGFAISRVNYDFASHLESQQHLSMMFSALADAFEQWKLEQKTIEVCCHFDSLREVEEFYSDYLKMPFRDPSGGSRFNNLLWLNLISKMLQPSVIVDSGTYTGASAWALHRGAPSAKLFSFDIDLSNLLWRSPRAKYLQHDWTGYDFHAEDLSRALCYFDDHLDQVRRLMEARERNFPYAIFDDDFPVSAFPKMASTAAPLPKIEFALNESLKDGEEIVWTYNGVRRSWRVSRKYLDEARAAISATDRLPNTSCITGIHQTPYRVVALGSGLRNSADTL